MRKQGGRFGQPNPPRGSQQPAAHGMGPNFAHARGPMGLWWDPGMGKGAKRRKGLQWKGLWAVGQE